MKSHSSVLEGQIFLYVEMSLGIHIHGNAFGYHLFNK